MKTDVRTTIDIQIDLEDHESFDIEIYRGGDGSPKTIRVNDVRAGGTDGLWSLTFYGRRVLQNKKLGGPVKISVFTFPFGYETPEPKVVARMWVAIPGNVREYLTNKGFTQ